MRERWKNQLDPSILKKAWSPEEKEVSVRAEFSWSRPSLFRVAFVAPAGRVPVQENTLAWRCKVLRTDDPDLLSRIGR